MQLLEVTIEDSDQERQRSEREADELRKQLAETSADTWQFFLQHCRVKVHFFPCLELMELFLGRRF